MWCLTCSPYVLRVGTLQSVGPTSAERILCRLLHRDALAQSNVNTLLHVDPHLVVSSVGVLLLGERLDVAITSLVGVINDPRLAFLAA